MRINNMMVSQIKIITTRIKTTTTARAIEEEDPEVAIKEENKAIRIINQLAQAAVLPVSAAV